MRNALVHPEFACQGVPDGVDQAVPFAVLFNELAHPKAGQRCGDLQIPDLLRSWSRLGERLQCAPQQAGGGERQLDDGARQAARRYTSREWSNALNAVPARIRRGVSSATAES